MKPVGSQVALGSHFADTQEVGWVELAGSIVWIETSNPTPKGILPLAKFYLLKVP